MFRQARKPFAWICRPFLASAPAYGSALPVFFVSVFWPVGGSRPLAQTSPLKLEWTEPPRSLHEQQDRILQQSSGILACGDRSQNGCKREMGGGPGEPDLPFASRRGRCSQ